MDAKNVDSAEVKQNMLSKMVEHYDLRASEQIRQGKLELALETYTELLEKIKKHFEQEDIWLQSGEYVACQAKIIMVLIQFGKEEAEAKAEMICSELKQHFQSQNIQMPAYASILNLYSAIKFSQQKFEEALDMSQTAQQIFERTIGTQNEQYYSTLIKIGNIALRTERFSFALSNFEKAAAIIEHLIGTRNEDYISAINQIGVTLTQLDRIDEAISKLNLAQQLTTETFGDNHHMNADILENMVSVYLKKNDMQQAANFAEHVWKMRERLLGPAHEDTLRTKAYYDQLNTIIMLTSGEMDNFLRKK